MKKTLLVKVSVVGPQGSGKTRLANRLRETLSTSGLSVRLLDGEDTLSFEAAGPYTGHAVIRTAMSD
jgi:adenylylsulfate kinase-like enzyme